MKDSTAKAIQRIEERLDRLIQDLAEEITTRRVRVIDGSGTERVVLIAEPDCGSVLVTINDGDAETTGVELYAITDVEDREPMLGLEQVIDGNVGAVWP